MDISGVCLVHYKLELYAGDTIDTFQLCRYDSTEKALEILATKKVQSKKRPIFNSGINICRYWDGCDKNHKKRR